MAAAAGIIRRLSTMSSHETGTQLKAIHFTRGISMKSLPPIASIATIVTLLLAQASKAETEEGTLTLQGDKITFQTKAKAIVSPPLLIGQEIPGAKIIKFQPRTITKNHQDLDVSELTLENQSDGSKITLVNGTPVKVRHIFDTTASTWKLIPNK